MHSNSDKVIINFQSVLYEGLYKLLVKVFNYEDKDKDQSHRLYRIISKDELKQIQKYINKCDESESPEELKEVEEVEAETETTKAETPGTGAETGA